MATNTVKVWLVGDATKLAKAFSDSERSAKGFGDKMSSAGRGLTLGLTAPIVAGAGLAVKAAAEEQQEMEKLAGAIEKNIPGATKAAIDANEEWITSMQNATGVADTDLRNAIQQLVQAGVPLEEAQSQTAIAMDIAAAKGKDLSTVTEALVKANNGNTGALGKMGIATKDASGEALTLDEVLGNAADTMGGSAATAADTAAGRAQILQARMADATETIGTMLIPIMEKLVGWLSQAVQWFQNLDPAAQKVIVAITAAAAAIGPVLIVGAKLVQAFGVIGKAFGVLSKLMMANPWLLLIAAVIALVIIIVTNWDKITAFLKKTWAWIQKTSAAVWEAVKSAIKAAIDWIVKLFLNWTLIGLLIKHWDKIKAGIAALIGWIKSIWNGLISWFAGLPGRISSAVSGLFNGLKTAFRNAINWIIGKWNSFRLQIKLPSLLGGGTLKIDTPNIPTFQGGGVFHAPSPGGAGLALLHDNERVTPAGAGRAVGATMVANITVNAGLGSDPNAIGKAIVEALQRYQRINGALPLDVRLN